MVPEAVQAIEVWLYWEKQGRPRSDATEFEKPQLANE